MAHYHNLAFSHFYLPFLDFIVHLIIFYKPTWASFTFTCFNPIGISSLFVAYWHALNIMCPKYLHKFVVFSKAHNQRWSAKLSLIMSIYHFHILPMQSFNEKIKKKFRDWNCIANGHAKLSCFIHFKQPNNNMHGYLTSFKKLITKANMSRFHIDLRHPLIEICRNCCYRCKIWQ